jgi:hypothetical protein
VGQQKTKWLLSSRTIKAKAPGALFLAFAPGAEHQVFLANNKD